MLDVRRDRGCFLLLIVVVLGRQASTKAFHCPESLRCSHKKCLDCIISDILEPCVRPSSSQDYQKNPPSQSPIANFLGDDAFLCTGSLLSAGWGYTVLLSVLRPLTLSDGCHRQFR